MYLDLVTMSVADIAVATFLAGLLILDWGRDGWSLEAAPRFVGSWGFATLVFSFGSAAMLSAALSDSTGGVMIGASLLIFAAALKWDAARRFAGRDSKFFWIVFGPATFLLVAYSGVAPSLDDRFALTCTLLAAYRFAAAMELRVLPDSCQSWPAVTLLLLASASYLSWIPIAFMSPLESVPKALTSDWFPFVVLATMLLRVALAFVILSMAKDRNEEEQRRCAMTDSLTGLPNRRALFEVADAVVVRRAHGGGTPVSLLIADLDFFKETNDTFGHSVGDEVLRLFAKVAGKSVQGAQVVGRLGGEEFAAILPGVDGGAAVEMAERLRDKFADSGSFVSGLPVGATVSIGVAADNTVDSGLSSLFRRADAALYAAKSAGRNRVVFVGAEDFKSMPGQRSVIRTAPTRLAASQLSLQSAALRPSA